MKLKKVTENLEEKIGNFAKKKLGNSEKSLRSLRKKLGKLEKHFKNL